MLGHFAGLTAADALRRRAFRIRDYAFGLRWVATIMFVLITPVLHEWVADTTHALLLMTYNFLSDHAFTLWHLLLAFVIILAWFVEGMYDACHDMAVALQIAAMTDLWGDLAYLRVQD